MYIIAKLPLGLDPETKLGPSISFRVIGASLLRADDIVIAHWLEHQWAVGPKRFTVLEIQEPARVMFLGPPTPIPWIGPFKHIRMADGSLRADNVVLARFHAATGLWTTATNVNCSGFALEPYVQDAREA